MRRFFVPEVVQTSNMDCGPAALKCLLEGFGISAGYGRLREACQTGLDGTSIDSLEAVANQLGLQAEQILLPADHLFVAEAQAFPAVAVVLLPNGVTHFVVLWRRYGNLLQIMDPAVGRRWVSIRKFKHELYSHRMPAAASDWREFAASGQYQSVLRSRLTALRFHSEECERLLAQAVSKDGWLPLAALDAAIRLLTSLAESGIVDFSQNAGGLLEYLVASPDLIPERYWSVRPAPLDSEGGEQLIMTGAVLVRVTGKQAPVQAQDLGRELAAAIEEKPPRPGRELLGALWHSGPLALGLLAGALLAAGAATVIEAMLLRGLLDVAQTLGLAGQRLGALASVLLFSVALLLLEIPCFVAGGRLGRQLENRLRIRFLQKIPKLGERYFRSRLTSDMAERSHATKRLRHLPDQVRQLLRAVFELGFTAAAIGWLEPSAIPFVCGIVTAALLPAFLIQPVLAEREGRVRSHAAGLTRFYLDALAGLLPVRAHGGESNIRREHGKLLGEWATAALSLQRVAVGLEALQLFAMFGLVALLLLARPPAASDIGRTLLLVYWALNLPQLGGEIGNLLRQYPYYRNLTLRLLDPLGAPEQEAGVANGAVPALAHAPALEFRNLTVRAAGHTILDKISLTIEPGAHVAIVGPSGAGKSSLLGILLGWLDPQAGEVLVDKRPLSVDQLRSSSAWVDPAVQLWNRSLLANVRYGASDPQSNPGEAMDQALLRGVLENLPEGMQTELGEGGALVSGGEGQRVRFARALLHKDAKLAILDEPFRGLDREKRHELLRRARTFWHEATLLCVTHDLSETRNFDQVVVIEHGRLTETGKPSDLLSDPESRYAQLLAVEEETRSELWDAPWWRRVHVRSGHLVEEAPVVGARVHDCAPAAEVA